jgi:alanyl-tRNA synthetase
MVPRCNRIYNCLMTSNEIRASFLAYFERQGHRVLPSSSLVPSDDPTLLFTNAGMNQFKDLFLGKERREYRRAATSQKCMRVSGKHNDLENVGPSLRHHTFFEMLGNFSFGDYFKGEAIMFAWELMTSIWRLPPESLRATVFGGEGGIPRDDEAYEFWRKVLPEEHIGKLGISDNFWAMGDTGPCGRCSEIHVFRGDHIPCPEPVCRGLSCSCDRFVEIWNNVFMEFERHADGSLKTLPAPSIDTGMGLERIAALLQGKLSNYDTDLFTPLLSAIEGKSGRRYQGTSAEDEGDVSMRVVADHLRATVFLVADGVVPSNEWRGYVLRKIMRRAMRHGNRLGLREPFMFRLVDVLVGMMGDAYPELRRGRDYVVEVVRNEEERFQAVLATGLPRLEEILEAQAAKGTGVIPGDEAFRLYDSYGLPLDFVEDLASQRGLSVDREGFDGAMETQRQRARADSAFGAGKGEDFSFRSDAERTALASVGDRFEGYTTTIMRGVKVLALFDESRRQVEELAEGAQGYAVLERTPFYVESGGQVSDVGRLTGEDGSAAVDGMTKLGPGLPRAHRVIVETRTIREGDHVTAEVLPELRDATRRNHTATHLLHAALRKVLGQHVKQAGSLVAPDRLRFDFVHFAPLSRDQIVRLETLVNEQVRRDSPVETEERATEEAMAAGAMALFGEKYGERVRVVSVPGFSFELCGGTHCRTTGEIGFFLILQEGGIAAGVRRIEALTGEAAVRHYQRRDSVLHGVLDALEVQEDHAVEAIGRLQSEVKRLGREVSQLKVRAAMGVLKDDTSASDGSLESVLAVDVEGVKLIARRVEDLDKSAMRHVADTLKERIGSGVVVVGGLYNGRVTLIVSVTADLAGRVHAGRLVKELAAIVGGGGGGRADFAEAGGKNPEKLDEVLKESPRILRGMLGQ